MTEQPKFLRREAAAKYLRDRYGAGSRKTLEKLASTGGGPIFTKFGGAVVYDVEDLDAWAHSRMRRFAATGVLAEQPEAG